MLYDKCVQYLKRMNWSVDGSVAKVRVSTASNNPVTKVLNLSSAGNDIVVDSVTLSSFEDFIMHVDQLFSVSLADTNNRLSQIFSDSCVTVKEVYDEGVTLYQVGGVSPITAMAIHGGWLLYAEAITSDPKTIKMDLTKFCTRLNAKYVCEKDTRSNWCKALLNKYRCTVADKLDGTYLVSFDRNKSIVYKIADDGKLQVLVSAGRYDVVVPQAFREWVAAKILPKNSDRVFELLQTVAVFLQNKYCIITKTADSVIIADFSVDTPSTARIILKVSDEDKYVFTYRGQPSVLDNLTELENRLASVVPDMPYGYKELWDKQYSDIKKALDNYECEYKSVNYHFITVTSYVTDVRRMYVRVATNGNIIYAFDFDAEWVQCRTWVHLKQNCAAFFRSKSDSSSQADANKRELRQILKQYRVQIEEENSDFVISAPGLQLRITVTADGITYVDRSVTPHRQVKKAFKDYVKDRLLPMLRVYRTEDNPEKPPDGGRIPSDSGAPSGTLSGETPNTWAAILSLVSRL